MPVKRRAGKVHERAITPEAVAAFKAGDWLALHAALRLHPWECNPLDANAGPSPWPPGCAGSISWPEAQRLRREIRREIREAKS